MAAHAKPFADATRKNSCQNAHARQTTGAIVPHGTRSDKVGGDGRISAPPSEKASRGLTREEHSSPPIGQRQPSRVIPRPKRDIVNVLSGLVRAIAFEVRFALFSRAILETAFAKLVQRCWIEPRNKGDSLCGFHMRMSCNLTNRMIPIIISLHKIPFHSMKTPILELHFACTQRPR